MKIKLSYFFVFLILVTPLYPALLTSDLQVIVPTGDPLFQEHCKFIQPVYQSIPGVSFRIIETSRGGLLIIREQTKPWAAQSSQIIELKNIDEKQLILNLIKQHELIGNRNNINVILE